MHWLKYGVRNTHTLPSSARLATPSRCTARITANMKALVAGAQGAVEAAQVAVLEVTRGRAVDAGVTEEEGLHTC